MDKIKRGALIVILSLFITILIIAMTSAGLIEWFKAKITGEVTQTTIVNVTVGAGGNAPTIVFVFNDSTDAVTLKDGPSNINISINFTARDSDGAVNLDSSKARVNVTKTGEATRYNSTCSQIESSGNDANYSCLIDMWWFDGAGGWTINATITDLGNNEAYNSTTTLNVKSLTGFNLGPATVTFATIAAGATNTTSTTSPLLNNTGNTAISDGNIQVNATHLVGETTTSEKIYTGNMTAGATTGSNAECNFPATAAQMNLTSGAVYTAISGANLSAGNYTLSDGTAQEQLYVCITLAGSELSQQAYSTLQEGAWTIQVT